MNEEKYILETAFHILFAKLTLFLKEFNIFANKFTFTFLHSSYRIMENYIVSARKYRPMTFDAVVGQTALTTTLKNSIKNGKLAHAYLFCGPRGVGKTTCARIFAKTINCLNPRGDGEACNECESCTAFNEQRSYSIHELDAASNNSVEDIRQLIEQVRIPPQIGKYKVFIIDEVHMLSTSAFNAFLKTLEEPPRHAIFILATTEKHKLLPTILSRCQIYDFSRMSVDDIVAHLANVAAKEGIKCEPAALNVIAQKADGGMRDALSIFDQVASFCGGNITYQQTIKNLNVLDYDYYFKITDQCLEGKITDVILTLNEILSKGFDGQHFITGLASHFRNLLVSRDAQTVSLIDASDDVRQRYQQQAQKCQPRFIMGAMKLCNTCDLNYKTSQNKRLLVELTLIETVQLAKGEDVPGSGRKPKKVLSPIFATTKQQVVATNRAPKATPVPIAVPKPKQQAVFTPTFSIRAAMQQQFAQSSVQTATKQVEQPVMDTPFDLKALTIAWREFIQELPHDEIAMQNRMDNLEPKLIDKNTFEVIADNPTFEQELKQYVPRVERFLHQRLKNSHIRMSVRLREASDRKKIFSRAEIFADMLSKSEPLRKMKEQFGLELG